GGAAADAVPDCVMGYAATAANKPRHATSELVTAALDVDAGTVPAVDLHCVAGFVESDLGVAQDLLADNVTEAPALPPAPEPAAAESAVGGEPPPAAPPGAHAPA